MSRPFEQDEECSDEERCWEHEGNCQGHTRVTRVFCVWGWLLTLWFVPRDSSRQVGIGHGKTEKKINSKKEASNESDSQFLSFFIDALSSHDLL